MTSHSDKNYLNFNFNTQFNKFHSSEKDIRAKKETDINFFFDDLKFSPKNVTKKINYSNQKKEKQLFNALLATDFLFSSPKNIQNNQNKYNDIFTKEQQERNKKIEILLNARLKEQKNLEKRTQTYFFDEYFATNTSNIKNFNKNESKDNKEKLDKYKYDFIKIHKKQLENEKDRRNLLKKLLEKTNSNNNEIRKSLDIGKFHYFLKSQFEDKSFFDDCLEDSFFNRDLNVKNLVNKSPDKSNFEIFKEKIKPIKNKIIYDKNGNIIIQGESTNTTVKAFNKNISADLAQKDENFKSIFEKLISGNKKFLEAKNKSLDNTFHPNISIFNTNQNSKMNIHNNTMSNIEKYNNNNNNLLNINNNSILNSNNNLINNNGINNSNSENSNKNPKFFIFTCTDCEIDTAALFGLTQEDVFVYRNIGNIIISKDVNFICAVQYAIENLNIRNFIILGHTGCRALKDAIYPSKQGIKNKWLKNIRAIAEANRNLLYEAKRDSESYDFNFSQINIKEQMKRFSELEFIQNMYSKGEKIYIYGFQVLNNIGKVNDIEIISSY